MNEQQAAKLPAATGPWVRIMAGGYNGERRKLVYWKLPLSDGGWIAVKRSRTARLGAWQWEHYCKARDKRAGGWSGSVPGAKRAAERYLAPQCPHGCGPLRWVVDQYQCSTCRDEWHYETVHGSPSTVHSGGSNG